LSVSFKYSVGELVLITTLSLTSNLLVEILLVVEITVPKICIFNPSINSSCVIPVDVAEIIFVSISIIIFSPASN